MGLFNKNRIDLQSVLGEDYDAVFDYLTYEKDDKIYQGWKDVRKIYPNLKKGKGFTPDEVQIIDDALMYFILRCDIEGTYEKYDCLYDALQSASQKLKNL